MAEKNKHPSMEDDEGIDYTIKVKGHLEEHWADWLGGLKITHDPQGNSLLTGIVPDQAALHAILAQIRDLGLTLISITPKGMEGEIQNGDDENG